MSSQSRIASLIHSIFVNRYLMSQLAHRDFVSRFRGGVLGSGWALFNPLLMLGLYSFVFVVVFKMRWGAGATGDTHGNFVVLLFSGLIVHTFFAENVTRAPHLIVSNVSYVKKITFPLELLSLLPIYGASINFGIGLVLIAALLFSIQGSIPWTILLAPIVFAPFALLVAGLNYFLSATGVYLRDLSQIMGTIITVAMFASPVLYPLENVPEPYRNFLYLNPLTLVVEQLRRVAILGDQPDWVAMMAYTVVAAVIFCLGFLWFEATRRGFSDAL